jgi:hypothetical protein
LLREDAYDEDVREDDPEQGVTLGADREVKPWGLGADHPPLSEEQGDLRSERAKEWKGDPRELVGEATQGVGDQDKEQDRLRSDDPT